MCQTKEQGGRRCPSHQPGYLGLKTLIEKSYDLDEQQIRHSYDVLRLQGANHPNPTMHEYEKFIRECEAKLRASDVSNSIRRRVHRQLSKQVNDNQLPDGSTFYAMTHLMQASKNQRRRINANLRRVSRVRGLSYEEVEEQFKDILDSTVTPLRQVRRGALDARTRAAFEKLEQDNPVIKEDVRRVLMNDLKASSSVVEAAGYDREDGRLEVQIDGDTHAFRNISEDEWEAFQHAPIRSMNEFRSNPDKQYASAREADEDAYRVWCEKCKKFRLASGHRCSASGNIESMYQAVRASLAEEKSSPLRSPAWYKPWEKRRIINLKNNPSSSTVRELVDKNELAEFTLTFTTQAGDKVSANFTAGRATPRDITLRMDSAPRCTCPEYERNYSCKHTNGRGFQRSVLGYYERLDQGSADRNPQLRFPYEAYGPEGKFVFSCPQTGLTPEMINDIAYVCQSGNRAMVYLNNKEIRGNGEALGALTFSLKGMDIEVVEQASCRICHRTDCHHIKGISQRFASRIQEKLLSPDYRLRELDRMQREREEEMRSHDTLANRVPGVRQTPRYSDDIESYISDLREAEKKVKAGQSPLEFRAASVTNGNLSAVPGEGKGFGVEIEYVVDDERQRQAIQDEIAQELVASGLSRESYGFSYGTSSQFTHYQEWAVEDDASVSGEVISPIMYDTPESWSQIAKVCDIIKKHGGKVDETCGQHVHIGVENPGVSTNIGIMQFMQANQDSIRRAGTNPERKSHRNNMYSIPLHDDDAQSMIYDMRNRIDDPLARDRMVNFGNEGHIEFRDADGSLDPAHIQAQVMIAAAIVASGERGDLMDVPSSAVRTQEVGTNRKRTQLLTGGRMKHLSDEELTISDISYRKTIDSLFDDEHSKKTMVALAALVPWQKSLR